MCVLEVRKSVHGAQDHGRSRRQTQLQGRNVHARDECRTQLMADVVKAAVAAVVGGEKHLMVAPRAHRDNIVHMAAHGVEVEDENEAAALKGDHMIVLPQELEVGRTIAQDVVFAESLDHVVVKEIELAVFQVAVFRQAPLAAAVFVIPAVALAREVDPLGVAEFVAHEVQVGVTGGSGGY